MKHWTLLDGVPLVGESKGELADLKEKSPLNRCPEPVQARDAEGAFFQVVKTEKVKRSSCVLRDLEPSCACWRLRGSSGCASDCVKRTWKPPERRFYGIPEGLQVPEWHEWFLVVADSKIQDLETEEDLLDSVLFEEWFATTMAYAIRWYPEQPNSMDHLMLVDPGALERIRKHYAGKLPVGEFENLRRNLE